MRSIGRSPSNPRAVAAATAGHNTQQTSKPRTARASFARVVAPGHPTAGRANATAVPTTSVATPRSTRSAAPRSTTTPPDQVVNLAGRHRASAGIRASAGLLLGLTAGAAAAGTSQAFAAPLPVTSRAIAGPAATSPVGLGALRSATRASRSLARAAIAPSVAAPAPQVVERTVPIAPSESGVASWYGGNWAGRTTASGEIFDIYAMTAAHPWLPFGTHLRVCTSWNCVVVRVTDRGPYAAGRIVDLSQGAATTLGILSSGVAYVTATPVETRTETVLVPVPDPARLRVVPAPPVGRSSYLHGFHGSPTVVTDLATKQYDPPIVDARSAPVLADTSTLIGFGPGGAAIPAGLVLLSSAAAFLRPAGLKLTPLDGPDDDLWADV